MWIATNELPSTGGHPFYQRLNHFLDAHGFDDFVEAQCAAFYAATVGRPSVMPGTYFRLLLIGYCDTVWADRMAPMVRPTCQATAFRSGPGTCSSGIQQEAPSLPR